MNEWPCFWVALRKARRRAGPVRCTCANHVLTVWQLPHCGARCTGGVGCSSAHGALTALTNDGGEDYPCDVLDGAQEREQEQRPPLPLRARGRVRGRVCAGTAGGTGSEVRGGMRARRGWQRGAARRGVAAGKPHTHSTVASRGLSLRVLHARRGQAKARPAPATSLPFGLPARRRPRWSRAAPPAAGAPAPCYPWPPPAPPRPFFLGLSCDCSRRVAG